MKRVFERAALDAAKVVRLYTENDLTMRALGQRFGVPPERIADVLKGAGVLIDRSRRDQACVTGGASQARVG